MPKFTIVVEETIVSQTTIEAPTADDAARVAEQMVEEDLFPNDCLERQGGKITVYDTTSGSDESVAEIKLN